MYLYQHSKSKKKFAVKKLVDRQLKSMRIGTSNYTASDLCKEELKNLKKLHHPNIIWLHEVIDDPDGTIYFVTDYYPNGSLEDAMKRINAVYPAVLSKNLLTKPATRGLTNM